MTILVILAVFLGIVVAVVLYRTLTRPNRKEYGRGPEVDTPASSDRIFEDRATGYNPLPQRDFRNTRSQPVHRPWVDDSSVGSDGLSHVDRFGPTFGPPAMVSATYDDLPQPTQSDECKPNDACESSSGQISSGDTQPSTSDSTSSSYDSSGGSSDSSSSASCD